MWGVAQGLTSVPEDDARRVFQQMMVAVDYCHRLGVANRDIKVRTSMQRVQATPEFMPKTGSVIDISINNGQLPLPGLASNCVYLLAGLEDTQHCLLLYLARSNGALNPGTCLQLDNVLLAGRDPQLVKLCDFGYSKDGDLESACKTTCGTPEYMAPEVSGAQQGSQQNPCQFTPGCVKLARAGSLVMCPKYMAPKLRTLSRGP